LACRELEQTCEPCAKVWNHSLVRKTLWSVFTGDSYIVLSTTQGNDEDGALLFDVFFWIGSESKQDDVNAVAYKTKLGDPLNAPAIRHREVQCHESNHFLAVFKGCINYLNEGISGGLREILNAVDYKTLPPILFHI